MFETSNYQLWPEQLVHSNKRGNQETRLSKVGCKSMLKYIWGSPWIHNDPEVSVGRRHLFCSMPPRPISQSLLSPFVQSVSLEGRQLWLSPIFWWVLLSQINAVDLSLRILHLSALGSTARCHLFSARWLQLPGMSFINGARRVAVH